MKSTPAVVKPKRRAQHLRRAQKQNDAKLRKYDRNVRGDIGQLLRLELTGHGHCKEARKLAVRLSSNLDSPAYFE